MEYMKKIWLAILALTISTGLLSAQVTATVTGVEGNGFAGVYDVNGTNYWWMCIEPNGTPNAALGESYTANWFWFEDGWDQQNNERFDFFNVQNPAYQTTVIPKQVTVMTYVLDTYLPWDTLAGASGRFIEQDSDPLNYENNTDFYNSLFVVQNFLSEMYGKPHQNDFTDLSNFVNNWDGDVTATGIARQALFQSILDDVEGKDGVNHFDTYTAIHGYSTLSVRLDEADPDNWQDVLVITSFAPVPEPSGALLIACCGVAVMLRRFRRLA